MKTNKQFIKHINDKLYTGAKQIDLNWCEFDGRVYFEEIIYLRDKWEFANEPNKTWINKSSKDLSKKDWLKWLKDYTEILTDLGKVKDLTITRCVPELKVNVGVPYQNSHFYLGD